jgi:hypothetical protein
VFTSDDHGRSGAFTLIGRIDSLFSKTFAEASPGWSEAVAEALGPRLGEVEQAARSFSPLGIGIPRDKFTIHSGYRINLSRMLGSCADARAASFSSLLMGCGQQPGGKRDMLDLRMR